VEDRTAPGTRANRGPPRQKHLEPAYLQGLTGGLGLDDPEGTRLQEKRPALRVDRPLHVMGPPVVPLHLQRERSQLLDLLFAERRKLLFRLRHGGFHGAPARGNDQFDPLARDTRNTSGISVPSTRYLPRPRIA